MHLQHSCLQTHQFFCCATTPHCGTCSIPAFKHISFFAVGLFANTTLCTCSIAAFTHDSFLLWVVCKHYTMHLRHGYLPAQQCWGFFTNTTLRICAAHSVVDLCLASGKTVRQHQHTLHHGVMLRCKGCGCMYLTVIHAQCDAITSIYHDAHQFM